MGIVRFLRRCTRCLVQVIHYCQNITSNGAHSHPRPLARQIGMAGLLCGRLLLHVPIYELHLAS